MAPFQPPEGWQVEPAPKPEDWKPNLYAWVGKRIAHKFDSGWSCLGTYKEWYNGYDKRYRGMLRGMHKVKYVDGYDGYHPLSASTYGMAGHWVILKAYSRLCPVVLEKRAPCPTLPSQALLTSEARRSMLGLRLHQSMLGLRLRPQ